MYRQVEYKSKYMYSVWRNIYWLYKFSYLILRVSFSVFNFLGHLFKPFMGHLWNIYVYAFYVLCIISSIEAITKWRFFVFAAFHSWWTVLTYIISLILTSLVGNVSTLQIVLVTGCYVANHLKMWWLKTMTTFILLMNLRIWVEFDVNSWSLPHAIIGNDSKAEGWNHLKTPCLLTRRSDGWYWLLVGIFTEFVVWSLTPDLSMWLLGFLTAQGLGSNGEDSKRDKQAKVLSPFMT